MPALAFAEAAESVSQVTQISDDRRRYGVDQLAPQQQIAGKSVLKADNVLEEHDHQRKPHRGTEVVLDVTEAVR